MDCINILDDKLIILDFNVVCRFCLKSNKNGVVLSNIFNTNNSFTNNIQQQIRVIAQVEVDPTDGYPDKICHRCRFKIESCYEFKEMVARTEKVLTNNTIQKVLYCTSDNENAQTPLSEEHNKGFEIHLEELRKDTMVIDSDSNQDDNEKIPTNLDDFNMFLIRKADDDELRVEDEVVETVEVTNRTKVKRKKKVEKTDEYPTLFTAKRRNQCLLCLEKCDSRENLKEHIDKHLEGTELEPYYLCEERDLLCKSCDCRFNYRYNFIIHQREHLNLKPFICLHAGCMSAYSSVYKLRNHSLVHADKKFSCSVCKNAKFQRKSDLRAHEIIHLDEGRKFQCSICKIICKNRRTLGAHVRKHYETPRFKCEICPKAYLHHSELERHMHIHSPDKRFKCALCCSAYYSRTALVRHEKKHELQSNKSIKKFCPLKVCLSSGNESVFTTTKSYKDHMESHPSTDYPYSCLNCDNGFVTRSSLTKHMMSCCPTVITDIIESEECIVQENVDSSTFVHLEEADNMEDVFDDDSHLLIVKKDCRKT